MTDLDVAMQRLFREAKRFPAILPVGRYARHAIIHIAYKDNPYKHAMHLYNAGYRGRELNWGYLNG